jgi:hypothetical protein
MIQKTEDRSQRTAGSWQKSEIRGQTLEVRVKLISDLRLLTSVMGDFNGFYD